MAALDLIVDSDWGGDVLQIAAVILANPASFRFLGGSVVFGNVPQPQAFENARRLLAFLGAPDIPVFAGAAAPLDAPLPAGDGAHGADGLGGIALPPSLTPERKETACDWILETLRAAPPQSVTLIATGPQTNLALALRKDPATFRRARQIRIMGGCTQPLPAKDRAERQGNITPWAEFNFYMAPADAHAVLNSGVPIVLFPMNVTHQLTWTPPREEALRTALCADPAWAARVLGLMAAPREMDARKFGIAPVLHDVHTVLSLLAPALYSGRRGHVSLAQDDARRGQSTLTPDPQGPVECIEKLHEPDLLFTLLQKALLNRLMSVVS